MIHLVPFQEIPLFPLDAVPSPTVPFVKPKPLSFTVLEPRLPKLNEKPDALLQVFLPVPKLQVDWQVILLNLALPELLIYQLSPFLIEPSERISILFFDNPQGLISHPPILPPVFAVKLWNSASPFCLISHFPPVWLIEPFAFNSILSELIESLPITQPPIRPLSDKMAPSLSTLNLLFKRIPSVPI